MNKNIKKSIALIISILLLGGCSKENIESSNTELSLDNIEENINDNISEDTYFENKVEENIEENEKNIDIGKSSYKEMSDKFFEATDKKYDIDKQIKEEIINITKKVLKEIENDKNEKIELSIIKDGSTAINSSSKTLKLNINQIYGVKELTNYSVETTVKAIVLHEIGHHYTQETSELVNSLIFESIMDDKKVMELTEEELEELIITPEVKAWEFVENYMNENDYNLIKEFTLATYYDSYQLVIDSNEPVKYNDTFSIRLKKQ